MQMWVLRIGLLAAVSAIVFRAQTSDFSTITESRIRAEAVRAAGKQLAGRTDPAAIAQWDRILAEMHSRTTPN